MEAVKLEGEEREDVPFFLLGDENLEEEVEEVVDPPLEELEEASRLFFAEPLVPKEDAARNFSMLNRIFDGRLACRHLSDDDLLALREWHKDLKKMLLQKGDRYTLAIQSIKIDIDKMDRLVDFRQIKPKVAPMTSKAPVASTSAVEGELKASDASLSNNSNQIDVPQNEGTLIVLSQMHGWKTLNVEKLISQKLEEIEQIEQQKVQEDSKEKIDERLSESYNGGASPYGYRGTFS